VTTTRVRRASQRDGVGEDPRVLRFQAAAGDNVDLGAQQVLKGEFKTGVVVGWSVLWVSQALAPGRWPVMGAV